MTSEPDAPHPTDAAEVTALLTPVQVGLADAVREIERHVASGGWDGPVRVFALVSTAAALEAQPALEERLGPEVVRIARENPHHLISVEQDGLPATDDLEDLLAGISWPETVDGAAVVVERVMLPPSAEEEVPEDPQEALAYLHSHPDRQDVRLAVGVLRDGTGWCAVRTRAQDEDDAVAGGPRLVPGLVEALLSTLT